MAGSTAAAAAEGEARLVRVTNPVALWRAGRIKVVLLLL
jgi:hypothetical protein